MGLQPTNVKLDVDTRESLKRIADALETIANSKYMSEQLEEITIDDEKLEQIIARKVSDEMHDSLDKAMAAKMEFDLNLKGMGQ